MKTFVCVGLLALYAVLVFVAVDIFVHTKKKIRGLDD